MKQTAKHTDLESRGTMAEWEIQETWRPGLWEADEVIQGACAE